MVFRAKGGSVGRTSDIIENDHPLVLETIRNPDGLEPDKAA